MKLPERAAQIWTVLAWAAKHRQNMTYSQLTQLTGAFTGGLGALLEPIQSYCLTKDLPPLTVLVVKQETGLPGSGFTGASAHELGAAQAKVFNFDWLSHGNPGPEELEKAVKSRPSNGTLKSTEQRPTPGRSASSAPSRCRTHRSGSSV